MNAPLPGLRCGIDRVAIARIERWLAETPEADVRRVFSDEELRDAGSGPERAAHLAGRFAAKEACLKLFPREVALGEIEPGDVAVARDGYGAPQLIARGKLEELLARHRFAGVVLSVTHDRTSAEAVAVARAAQTTVSLAGRLIYHLLPIRRRVVLENLQRVFGGVVEDDEIVRLAQAHYAHMGRLIWEFLRFPWLSSQRRAGLVRIENEAAIRRVYEQGKGVLLLTGHFGNWEVTLVAGMQQFPQYRNQFHILRRQLRPRFFEMLVTGRFRRAGLGVLPAVGALDRILERLDAGEAVVFVLDQHAASREGVVVDFFGHPASTFRSLAIISLATGVPVVPASAWRAADGTHVLRFEDALPIIECDDADEAIRRNTRAYNAALERLVLRRPEQWFWMHRRWKVPPRP